MCYSFFGNSTAQSFPKNLGRDLDMELLPGPLSFVMSLVSLVSMSVKQLVTIPLLAAPILSSLENSLTLTRFGSRSLLKLCLVLLTAGFCIFWKTNLAVVVELVGVVPQNCACIVLPCAALVKLRWAHLSIVQRGILITLATFFAGYGIGTTVCVIVHAVSS